MKQFLFILMGQNLQDLNHIRFIKLFKLIMTKLFRLSGFKLVLLSLLLAVCLSYTCKKYAYSYYLLALQWPTQYCFENNCKPNWNLLVPKNQFSIYGFWPSSQNSDYANCIQYNGHDPNCYIDYPYNQTKFNSSTLNGLNKNWPQIGSMNNFREYQWKKHGSCYMSIMKTFYQASFANDDQIFVQYFTDTLARIQSWVNVKMTKFQFKTKQELAAALNVYPDQFYAICENGDNQISQVQVCFSLAKPGSEVTTDCPTSGPSQCAFPAILRTSFQSLTKILFLVLLLVMGLIF